MAAQVRAVFVDVLPRAPKPPICLPARSGSTSRGSTYRQRVAADTGYGTLAPATRIISAAARPRLVRQRQLLVIYCQADC